MPLPPSQKRTNTMVKAGAVRSIPLPKSTGRHRRPQFVTGLTKQAIRSKILQMLKTQKEEDRNRKSKEIKNKLFRALVFKKAKAVMFYIAFGGEVDTKDIIGAALRLGKRVAVPFCRKAEIAPCVFEEQTKLVRGRYYGTRQPQRKRLMEIKDIDLVIVPGIAFDKAGNRLGRGGGCYDAFLRRLPDDTPRIGLAFDFQILPNLPTTLYDQSVNRVIFA